MRTRFSFLLPIVLLLPGTAVADNQAFGWAGPRAIHGRIEVGAIDQPNPVPGAFWIVGSGGAIDPLGPFATFTLRSIPDGPWLPGPRIALGPTLLLGSWPPIPVSWRNPEMTGALHASWGSDIYDGLAVMTMVLRIDGDSRDWSGSVVGTGDPVSGAFERHGVLVGAGDAQGS